MYVRAAVHIQQLYIQTSIPFTSILLAEILSRYTHNIYGLHALVRMPRKIQIDFLLIKKPTFFPGQRYYCFLLLHGMQYSYSYCNVYTHIHCDQNACHFLKRLYVQCTVEKNCINQNLQRIRKKSSVIFLLPFSGHLFISSLSLLYVL